LPYQSRRAQHGDRQRRASRRARRRRFDLAQQVFGLARGRGTQLAPQHLGATLVGGARGRGIATQVVQAHDAPIGMFGHRIEGHQRLRMLERSRQLARGLRLRRYGGQPLTAPRLAGKPRGFEPVGETARLLQRNRRKQVAVLVEIVRNTRSERGMCARRDQLGADALFHAQQARAQVAAGSLGIDVGPQPLGNTRARGLSLDGQQRQQQRILDLEFEHRAVGQHTARRAAQAKLRMAWVSRIVLALHAREIKRIVSAVAEHGPVRGRRSTTGHRQHAACPGGEQHDDGEQNGETEQLQHFGAQRNPIDLAREVLRRSHGRIQAERNNTRANSHAEATGTSSQGNGSSSARSVGGLSIANIGCLLATVRMPSVTTF
jgi:hypothetical protein